MRLRDLLDDERPRSVEGFLLLLVAAVRRGDDEEEERDDRDVYKVARKRRRRLGILAFGAGPLVGVANQLADLYCETAIVSDIAALRDVELSDEDLGAHMLVLWGIAVDWDVARAAMGGDPPVASLIGEKLRAGAAEQIPEELTTRSVIKALWSVRGQIGDVKDMGTDAFRTVMFTGHRTKQVIARAEAQLGVEPPKKRSRWLRGPAV